MEVSSKPVKSSKRKGFTLIEIIIVLSILAILMGIAVPMIYRQLASSAEQATKEEMENLKKSFIGDPEKVQNGVRTDFGAIGDWGGLLPSLQALVEAQTPAWSYDKEKKAGAGWKGPYISGEEGEYLLDGWGNEYVYSTADYTNGKGELVDGKIVSYGPSKAVGGGDDLTIEILKRETTTKVFGYIRDSGGNYLFKASVTIFFPQNGELFQQSCLTDTKGYYEFSSIPFGIRSVQAEPKLVYMKDSAKAIGNEWQNVEFKVGNFSEGDITINSLKAEYVVTPAAWYRALQIGGSTKWKAAGGGKDGKDGKDGKGSGDTVTFSSYTLAGTGVKREPCTVYIESSEAQIPDIYIAGGGNITVFGLNDFRDKAKGGAFVDMTGVNFTVTFSDGSVINFTTQGG